MSNQPIPGGSAHDDQNDSLGELSIKSDTFAQVSDADAAMIKGGGRETSNPTSDNGCCGSDARRVN